MKASVCAAAFVFAASALAATPALAASAEDVPVTWSVSPADADGGDGRAWVESTLEPGDELTEYAAIRNLGEASATFRLTAADGYFTETGRFNMLQAGQESVDAGTWISVTAQVSVEPGETAVVPFTITVPEDATPGDHPAGIAASVTTTGATTDGARIGVDSRVGFRVMTRVAGDLAPALEVRGLAGQFTPSWNLFTPGTISIGYEAINAGNTQLSFEDTTSTTTTRGDLFPGETRRVSMEPVAAWPIGLQTVEVTIAASVAGDTSLAAEPVTERLVFWAMPWLHLALVAGLSVIVAAAVFARRRSAARMAALLEQARAEGRRERGSAVLE